MISCLTPQGFTNEVTIKLKNFGRMQEALSRELLEAKPLGICKIITSHQARQSFKSLGSMLESGNVTMRIDIILTRKESEDTI